jgi:TetR/AcrR family transcriptional regulator, transcriptional repressor for nem operon
MPRQREFNLQSVLEKAMNVFWQRGFSSTSIDHLVREAGISRYGLYGEFQTKETLYLSCLEHYEHFIVSRVFGPVEGHGADVNDIEHYFNNVLALGTADHSNQGCLMVNTASDVAPFLPAAAAAVQRYRLRLRLGFKQALGNARNMHQISSMKDIEATADFLTGAVFGLSVLLRSGSDAPILSHFVEGTLTILKT